MAYKIRCKAVHPVNGALPGPLCTNAGYTLCSGLPSVHLCAASLQNLAVQQDFYALSVSLWNVLAYPVFDGVGLAGFKSRANVFFIGLSCSIPTIDFYYFSLLFFLSIGWYCGAGVFGLIWYISLFKFLSLALPTFFNNNNNNWRVWRTDRRTEKHGSFNNNIDVCIYQPLEINFSIGFRNAIILR